MAHELAGKNFIVTGGNSGIGKVTARELARAWRPRDHRVALGRQDAAGDRRDQARDRQRRTSSSRSSILRDLDSVRACAEALLANGMTVRRPHQQRGLRVRPSRRARPHEGGLRADVRHEPPRPLPVHAPAARSDQAERRTHRQCRERLALPARRASTGSALRKPTTSLTGLARVRGLASSRTCCSRRSSRSARGTGVTTYAVHPGSVATDVWRGVPGPMRWVMKKASHDHARARRGRRCCKCATDPALANETGHYYDARRRASATPSKLAARRRASRASCGNAPPSGSGCPREYADAMGLIAVAAVLSTMHYEGDVTGDGGDYVDVAVRRAARAPSRSRSRTPTARAT